MQPKVHPFFEHKTCSWQYVVACPQRKEAAIIDPVLNYDPENFIITSESADELIGYVVKIGYTVTMLLKTHIHEGHISAAYYIQHSLWSLGQPHALSASAHFAHKFHIPNEEIDHAFDHLFEPDEIFKIGDVICIALSGHPPDHEVYKIGDSIFMGDTMFNPDVRSVRCDFPGSDAREHFRSMKRILSFPPETKLYTAHGYFSSDEDTAQDLVPYVMIGEQERKNKHVTDELVEDHFVKWRTERDKVIPERGLTHQAPQVNVLGGRMPDKSHDGKGYLLYVI
ncbi:hypothetical protein N7447_010788 [Penicillium robsamsonii]|uniref:uncharacterized protein n=1 Tax=Penicillium robsamsonii TaxID=1792511 RepID=UPI002546B514|nr:uncharacterized protein N7447_010788 [Penicillium robsamsonii]KAJ5807332.1 hypothetical protein N7447_010788 [Penicillium robsamsonii]